MHGSRRTRVEHACQALGDSKSPDLNAISNLIVVQAEVNGYEKKMKVLIDSGASCSYARLATIAQNESMFADAQRESRRRGTIGVRLATGVVVTTPKILVDLRLKFEDFDVVENCMVLDMDDRYDVILGMPWLARHQPWIDWKTKSIGASMPNANGGALAGHVPTSARSRPRFTSHGKVVDVGVCELRAPQGKTVMDRKAIKSKAPSHEEVEATKQAVSCLVSNVAAETSAPSRVEVDATSAPSHVEVEAAKQAAPCLGTVQLAPSKSEVEVRKQASTCLPTISVSSRRNARRRNARDTRVQFRAQELWSSVATTGSRESDDNMSSGGTPTTYRVVDGLTGKVENNVTVLEPLPELSQLHNMEVLGFSDMLTELKAGELSEMVVIRPEHDNELLNTSSVMDDDVLEEFQQQFEKRRGTEILKDPSDPLYLLLMEYNDVVCKEPPTSLPPDRGVRHEIDLVPGTKYCVTRQWALPKEQVDFIDKFFEAKEAAGFVRESKSPHTTPTFCVKKPNGKWRIVHAYNKLNAATIPAQTPIPRKDVMLNSMSGSTVFSALDLVDGYYQILMREQDVPLTAVSTPSGMLWEWLVMPQGLSNAPATFNRLVTQLFRPMRQFAQTYFDDIFVHSHAEDASSDVDVHVKHLRQVLECMRANKLYANISKCIFGAAEIPFLGCFVGAEGIRADPGKIKAIVDWPQPRSQKDLRKWLGLANYLHRYSDGYAELVRPLSNLLKKDVKWSWTTDHEVAFGEVKESLLRAPILALPDASKPFSVVCDASDFAIGCALLQKDSEGRDRVIAFQSRQLKAAEKNYPVHDKELLAMKYALVKFRVHLLGAEPFVVYTDHASLRTATNSPHLSQRMARWLSFFAEYNFTVEYKPGKLNVLADALSRRPDYELSHLVAIESSLLDKVRVAYESDDACALLVQHFSGDDVTEKLSARVRARLHRYSSEGGVLYYSVADGDPPRVVVPHDDEVKHAIMFESHDSPVNGHLGREKTYALVSGTYWWPHMYKWVASYVKTCEVCQRVKPSPHSSAPLLSLPVPTDCWKSVSLDFIFGYPKDAQGRNGVVVFVDRLSKMVRLAPVRDQVNAVDTARIFMDSVFRHHGLPETLVSDRDPRFTSQVWRAIFDMLGTKLSMSTADHPQSDGQTERANRVVEDILRSVAADNPTRWSEMLPLVEFSINNAVHASTGFTPFYVNHMRNPRIPLTLIGQSREVSTSDGGSHNFERMLANVAPKSVRQQVQAMLGTRLAIMRRVRDAMANAQDKQKEQADKNGRKNKDRYAKGDLVLLNAKNLPLDRVNAVGSSKLRPRYVGPFKVLHVNGRSCTLQLPPTLQTHPTFYVGMLKPYRPADDGDHSGDPHRSDHRPPDGTPRSTSSEGVTRGAGSDRSTRESANDLQSTERTDGSAAARTDAARSLMPKTSTPGRPRGRASTGSTPASADARRTQPAIGSPSSRRGSEDSRSRLGRPPNAEHVAPVATTARATRDAASRPGRGPDRPSAAGADERHHRAPPPLRDSHGNQFYHVESLLKQRGEGLRRELLVKWRGYPTASNSWESRASMVADVPGLVEEFDQRQGQPRHR